MKPEDLRKELAKALTRVNRAEIIEDQKLDHESRFLYEMQRCAAVANIANAISETYKYAD